MAGYDGDGTQYEIANALAGSEVLLGVLPGGTGNGFVHELGLPQKLDEAARLLCISSRTPVKIEVMPGAVQVVVADDWVSPVIAPGRISSLNKNGGNMSSLVVISFDSPDEAEKVLKSLQAQTKYGNISFDDTALVSKDLDGKVHVKNEVSQGTMNATGIGALLGILLGGLVFPVAGILIGAGGGALMGRLMHMGVDGDFVKQVTDSLLPGTSALFVLVHDANPAVVRAILQEHPGKIIQTTLSSEAEESLKKALES